MLESVNKLMHPSMIKNYLTVAFRNILRDKNASSINILGLTIGMSCFCLIALYIQYEMSYDEQHEKADQIYRIAQQQEGNFFRGSDRFTGTPSVLSPTLRNQFPDVQAATTIQLYQMPLETDDKLFREQGLFADEFLFDVFTFPTLKGESKEPLKDPNSIILTKSLATKLFGDEDPIGKIMLIQKDHPVTVKAIVADVPKNHHFTFDFITSFRNLPFYEENRWNSNNFVTYVVLPEGYDYKELETKLAALKKYTDESYAGLPFKPSFFLQPLRSIHLHSNINFELGPNNDINNLWLFASVAFIILLLASINYMNLTTARSSLRGKEVGMRKVFGAHKWQLVYQFLGESALLTIISFFLAVALVNTLLPMFNQLLDEGITFGLSGNPWLLTGMLMTAILIGGLSGLYPGIFLSALLPVNAIKGILKKDFKGSSLRNILVVTQFSASIVLATGSIIIYRQLEFIQNKELGYNRDRIVYVPLRGTNITDRLSTIRTELLKSPQIENVSFPGEMPLNMASEGYIDRWEGNTTKQILYIYRNYVDYDFLDLFEIKLLEGRNFSPDHPTDSINGYLLNESAVKALGWTSAVGKEFNDGRVIGVVKDYHFQPFDLVIQPMFIRFRTQANSNEMNIAMKVKMDEPAKTLHYIQQTVKGLVPHVPIEYRFLDSDYNLVYQSQTRLGQAFGVFTILALFIACMGMFGLVSHHVFQRTKEIGIRKVLGATTSIIVGLLSKGFLKLVLISVVIATPIAWWTMNKWLEDFAYRIETEWWMFAFSGVIAVTVALFTISLQTVNAALANPAESLRSE
jgi:putative ABC transport system permease protein